MDIKTIFEGNIDNYSDFVDMDIAENMSRLYYRGIACHDPIDDDVLSMLIWELKSVESDLDTGSELKWIYAADPSYISPLLEGYSKEAQNDNVRRTFFECEPPGEERENALKESGFSLEQTESRAVDVTVDDCKNLLIAKKKAPDFVQSIDFLSTQDFYQGLMNILFRYDDPALEDMAFLPKDWYEPTISCFTKTDGKVTGFLLVHPCPSGILVPVLLFAVGADSRINLIEMLRFSINAAAENYTGDTVIRIYRRNLEVKALSAKFFPDKNGEPAVAGERREKG